MGSTFTKLFSNITMNIVMLGFYGSGKTTMLYELKLGEVVSTIPTIGFNVEVVEYKNITFRVWDIGGQNKIRDLWRYYFENTQALIFVVDSADKERIDEAAQVLNHLLTQEELRDAVLLVYANKQDLGVMSVAEVTEKLGLHKIHGREWYIQGTSAMTGDGLYDGMDWLCKACKNKK